MNTTALRKEPAVTGFTLKLLAIITMVIDHVGASIILHHPDVSYPDSAIYHLYWVMRIIGRLSMPIFLFLIIEGIQHTSNKFKYGLRLLIFALISEVPYDLCFHNSIFYNKDQNVMFTLCICVIVLSLYVNITNLDINSKYDSLIKVCYLIIPNFYFAYKIADYIQTESHIGLDFYFLYAITWICCEIASFTLMNRYSIRYGNTAAIKACLDILVLFLGMGVADLGHTDYSSNAILTVSVMYIFRANSFYKALSSCLILAALSSPLELANFCMLPIILRYDGHRGPSHQRYLYLVYPLHVTIIYIIMCITGMVQCAL